MPESASTQSSKSATASLVPRGQYEGKPAISLTRPVWLIGARKGCHLNLVSSTVSQVHAVIVNAGGGFYIKDLASRAGTIVNKKRVTEQQLFDGDKIEIGSFKFFFRDSNKSAGPLPEITPAQLRIGGESISVPLETRATFIGRRPQCDVPLSEESVSAAHALLFEMDGQHQIRDMASRTGTFVNGQKVHQQVLALGDVITIGDTELTYEAIDVAAAESLDTPVSEEDALSALEEPFPAAPAAELANAPVAEAELPPVRRGWRSGATLNGPAAEELTEPIASIPLQADEPLSLMDEPPAGSGPLALADEPQTAEPDAEAPPSLPDHDEPPASETALDFADELSDESAAAPPAAVEPPVAVASPANASALPEPSDEFITALDFADEEEPIEAISDEIPLHPADEITGSSLEISAPLPATHSLDLEASPAAEVKAVDSDDIESIALDALSDATAPAGLPASALTSAPTPVASPAAAPLAAIDEIDDEVADSLALAALKSPAPATLAAAGLDADDLALEALSDSADEPPAGPIATAQAEPMKSPAASLAEQYAAQFSEPAQTPAEIEAFAMAALDEPLASSTDDDQLPPPARPMSPPKIEADALGQAAVARSLAARAAAEPPATLTTAAVPPTPQPVLLPTHALPAESAVTRSDDEAEAIALDAVAATVDRSAVLAASDDPVELDEPLASQVLPTISATAQVVDEPAVTSVSQPIASVEESVEESVEAEAPIEEIPLADEPLAVEPAIEDIEPTPTTRGKGRAPKKPKKSRGKGGKGSSVQDAASDTESGPEPTPSGADETSPAAAADSRTTLDGVEPPVAEFAELNELDEIGKISEVEKAPAIESIAAPARPPAITPTPPIAKPAAAPIVDHIQLGEHSADVWHDPSDETAFHAIVLPPAAAVPAPAKSASPEPSVEVPAAAPSLDAPKPASVSPAINTVTAALPPELGEADQSDFELADESIAPSVGITSAEPEAELSPPVSAAPAELAGVDDLDLTDEILLPEPAAAAAAKELDLSAPSIVAERESSEPEAEIDVEPHTPIEPLAASSSLDEVIDLSGLSAAAEPKADELEELPEVIDPPEPLPENIDLSGLSAASEPPLPHEPIEPAAEGSDDAPRPLFVPQPRPAAQPAQPPLMIDEDALPPALLGSVRIKPSKRRRPGLASFFRGQRGDAGDSLAADSPVSERKLPVPPTPTRTPPASPSVAATPAPIAAEKSPAELPLIAEPELPTAPLSTSANVGDRVSEKAASHVASPPQSGTSPVLDDIEPLTNDLLTDELSLGEPAAPSESPPELPAAVSSEAPAEDPNAAALDNEGDGEISFVGSGLSDLVAPATPAPEENNFDALRDEFPLTDEEPVADPQASAAALLNEGDGDFTFTADDTADDKVGADEVLDAPTLSPSDLSALETPEPATAVSLTPFDPLPEEPALAEPMSDSAFGRAVDEFTGAALGDLIEPEADAPAVEEADAPARSLSPLEQIAAGMTGDAPAASSVPIDHDDLIADPLDAVNEIAEIDEIDDIAAIDVIDPAGSVDLEVLEAHIDPVRLADDEDSIEGLPIGGAANLAQVTPEPAMHEAVTSVAGSITQDVSAIASDLIDVPADSQSFSPFKSMDDLADLADQQLSQPLVEEPAAVESLSADAPAMEMNDALASAGLVEANVQDEILPEAPGLTPLSPEDDLQIDATPPASEVPFFGIARDAEAFLGGMPLDLPELAPPPASFGQVGFSFGGGPAPVSHAAPLPPPISIGDDTDFTGEDDSVISSATPEPPTESSAAKTPDAPRTPPRPIRPRLADYEKRFADVSDDAALAEMMRSKPTIKPGSKLPARPSPFDGLAIVPPVKEADVFSQPPPAPSAFVAGAVPNPGDLSEADRQAAIELAARSIAPGHTPPAPTPAAAPADAFYNSAVVAEAFAAPKPVVRKARPAPIAPPEPPFTVVRRRFGARSIAAAMVVCVLIAGFAAYMLTPVVSTIVARASYTNLQQRDALSQVKFHRDQEAALNDERLRNEAAAQLSKMDPTIPAGFLADGVAIEQMTRDPNLWPENTGDLQLTLESRNPAQDTRRLACLLNALYSQNQSLKDVAEKKKQDFQTAKSDLDTLQGQLAAIKSKMRTIQDNTGDRPSGSTIAEAEADATRLSDTWKQAASRTQDLKAQIDRLVPQDDAPVNADAAPAGDPEKDPIVLQMRADLKNLQNQIDAAKPQTNEAVDKARKGLDDSLSVFQDALTASQAQTSSSPEFTRYVAAAEKLQSMTKQLTSDVLDRQRVQNDRLMDLKRKMDDDRVARRDAIFAADPALRDLNDQLSMARRQYNAAAANGLMAEATRFSQEMNTVQAAVEAREGELSKDPNLSTKASDAIQQIIDSNTKSIAADQDALQAQMLDVTSTLNSEEPSLSKLPPDQKAVAETLGRKAADLFEARRAYISIVGSNKPQDDVQLHQLETQAATLSSHIDQRLTDLRDTDRKNQSDLQKAALARKIEDTKTALATAQKAEADAGNEWLAKQQELNQLHDKIDKARIDDQTLADGTKQRQVIEAEIAEQNKKVDSLQSLDLSSIVQIPPTAASISTPLYRDDRWKNAFYSAFGVMVLFGALFFWGNHQSTTIVPKAHRTTVQGIDPMTKDDSPEDGSEESIVT